MYALIPSPLSPDLLYSLCCQEGDILFEFQIENLMNVPIVIDHFVVLPAEGCTVVLQDYLDEANTEYNNQVDFL